MVARKNRADLLGFVGGRVFSGFWLVGFAGPFSFGEPGLFGTLYACFGGSRGSRGKKNQAKGAWILKTRV